MLTHKTCSNCGQWSELYGKLDDVIASICLVDSKVTKGSFSCSKWGKVKWREVYNPISDEVIRVREYRTAT